MFDKLIAYYDEKNRKKIYWQKVYSIISILLGISQIIQAYFRLNSDIFGNELILIIMGLLMITSGILGYVKFSGTTKTLSILSLIIAWVILFFS